MMPPAPRGARSASAFETLGSFSLCRVPPGAVGAPPPPRPEASPVGKGAPCGWAGAFHNALATPHPITRFPPPPLAHTQAPHGERARVSRPPGARRPAPVWGMCLLPLLIPSVSSPPPPLPHPQAQGVLGLTTGSRKGAASSFSGHTHRTLHTPPRKEPWWTRASSRHGQCWPRCLRRPRPWPCW